MTIYVENLPVGVTPADLAGLFAPYGRVTAARVWTDPDASPNYRVGFVDLAGGWRLPAKMRSQASASAALAQTMYQRRVGSTTSLPVSTASTARPRSSGWISFSP